VYLKLPATCPCPEPDQSGPCPKSNCLKFRLTITSHSIRLGVSYLYTSEICLEQFAGYILLCSNVGALRLIKNKTGNVCITYTDARSCNNFAHREG